MVAASSAVERPTDSDTLPVPDTRSEDQAGGRVRVSPFARVRVERRRRPWVRGLALKGLWRGSVSPFGPLMSTSRLAVPAPPASSASAIEVRCLAASFTVVVGLPVIFTWPDVVTLML